MDKRILITGGAGFIGSHLADELLSAGYRVRALDSLVPQVHEQRVRPSYLDESVELMVGDVRSPEAVARALDGVDAVVHLAAQVGVGQSMYQIADYTSTNVVGTATLLEALIKQPVERLVVASSMSIYGEGLYRAGDGRAVHDAERSIAGLSNGIWELQDQDGALLEPIPTPETKAPALSSVYALTKFDQERLCLMTGQAYRIPTVAARFFNVYGPRQALSNPYTGVLAIFAARLLNRRPPVIYEDGEQRRDFVSVYDVARALRLALKAPDAAGRAFNIGSGQSASVRDIASRLAAVLDANDIAPEITGNYRVGDIRHCFADISLARTVLGYQPQMTLEAGLMELAGWLSGQSAADRVDDAHAELTARGLTV
ncbi:MAG: NAD-dependent epimerase/dehydratase [Acidobacteria bacterium]|nr:NAD-dependent epimerase/dehydratase [Acidobacteriota bacterium]